MSCKWWSQIGMTLMKRVQLKSIDPIPTPSNLFICIFIIVQILFLNRTGQNEVDIEIIFLFIKTKIIYNQIQTSHTSRFLKTSKTHRKFIYLYLKLFPGFHP